jgi:hypothetical protein
MTTLGASLVRPSIPPQKGQIGATFGAGIGGRALCAQQVAGHRLLEAAPDYALSELEGVVGVRGPGVGSSLGEGWRQLRGRGMGGEM